jgi:hypothetical protein
MTNVSVKVIEKIRTHISRSIIFFQNRAVYEINVEKVVAPEWSQVTTLGHVL